MDYTTQVTQRTLFINEGRESHEWQVTDRKGRRRGWLAGTRRRMCRQVGRTIGQSSRTARRRASRTRPSNRGGEPFGAIQGWRFCKTEVERFHAVAEYLKGAEERAQSWQGR